MIMPLECHQGVLSGDAMGFAGGFADRFPNFWKREVAIALAHMAVCAIICMRRVEHDKIEVLAKIIWECPDVGDHVRTCFRPDVNERRIAIRFVKPNGAISSSQIKNFHGVAFF